MAPNSPSQHLLKLGLVSRDRPKIFPWHRLPPFRLFIYVYLSLLSFRFLILSLALQNPSQFQDYLTIDPTMFYFASLVSHQYIIALALVPASFFILAEDYLLFVRPNTFYWALAWEILLTNSCQFWELNSQLFNFQPFNWRHPIKSILQFKTQIITIWKCEETSFSQNQLIAFPVLSQKERTRIVLLELIWSKVELWILFGIALIQAIPFILGFFALFKILTLTQFLIVLFDLIILYLILFQLSYHLLFRLFLMLLTDYASRRTGRRLAAYLRSIWKHLQSARHLDFGLISKRLAFYRGAHWRLLHVMLRLDLEIVSPFLVVAFLTNFPVSICFQAALLQPGISSSNRLLTLTFLVAQLSIAILDITSMYGLFLTVYESPPILYPILLGLNGRMNILEKWKTSIYYEQLHSRKSFSFTAGPFGKITKSSFASLILMDLVYVMNISKMMMET